ncbi:MAG: transglutaminase domain-containing protein, partial [Burkholderiales bacterium]
MTKIHPLMLAAAIAFWGWQTGQWIVAVPVALIVCVSFYVSLRWALTTAQLTRVADFCTVLSLLLGAYLYLTYGNPRAVILFFQWLPLMFLPVALAHAYGTTEHMNMSVLFWSLRRRPPARPAMFDPWWPYYALWIVATSAANVRSEWFYIGLVALISWPLVRIRPWSYRVGTWGVAFSIAIGLGYALHYGLNTTQVWLEEAVPEWISGGGSRTDPYRATTDIGHIGKLKESDTIVLRVTVPDDAKPPELLHRASYNAYFGAAWLARGIVFTPMAGGGNNRWPLSTVADAAPLSRITIHDYSARPNPVLSLPTGTSALEGLKAITAQRNALGAVQIVREPGYFSYTAAYTGDAALDGAPTPEDTRVPPKEREAFEAVAVELGLTPRRPEAAVTDVKQFFANGYRYATFQKGAPLVGSPIVDFLHRSKSGHCEYFATATALLLRAGGIPARYATGFAIVEKSDRENAYIVRTRHAHAWVRAYVNDKWIDIDTTPPSWLSIEAEESGAWSKLSDLWSWLHFRASQAWANSDERQLLTGALIVVFPFALWLAWRLYRSRKNIKNNELKQMLSINTPMGSDSEFYRIEQRLTEQGWGRRAHETACDWLTRLKADAKMDTASLAEIVELHNRYRFDPMGLSDVQRTQLKNVVGAW